MSERLSAALEYAKRQRASETCAICGEHPERKRLARDHDHATGLRRELLCQRCNTALGLLRDNPKLLRKAAAYLDKHRIQHALLMWQHSPEAWLDYVN